jgi:hypothetical protein
MSQIAGSPSAYEISPGRRWASTSNLATSLLFSSGAWPSARSGWGSAGTPWSPNAVSRTGCSPSAGSGVSKLYVSLDVPSSTASYV